MVRSDVAGKGKQGRWKYTPWARGYAHKITNEKEKSSREIQRNASHNVGKE